MGEPVLLAFMPFGRQARRDDAEDSQNTWLTMWLAFISEKQL